MQVGLFLYSRHPNYFAEQALWVVVFLFTVHGFYINYSCVGCILLILLFQGSMAFSESITLSKYPSYADYQATTSQCIPTSKRFRKPKSYKTEWNIFHFHYWYWYWYGRGFLIIIIVLVLVFLVAVDIAIYIDTH